jgi:hypothetical protein
VWYSSSLHSGHKGVYARLLLCIRGNPLERVTTGAETALGPGWGQASNSEPGARQHELGPLGTNLSRSPMLTGSVLQSLAGGPPRGDPRHPTWREDIANGLVQLGHKPLAAGRYTPRTANMPSRNSIQSMGYPESRGKQARLMTKEGVCGSSALVET